MKHLAGLAALAIAPLLMAPPTEGCKRCPVRRLLSISDGDSSWQEVELFAPQRYGVQMVALKGQAAMQLFPLESLGKLQNLSCEGDDVYKTCKFAVEQHMMLGISIEPITEDAEVLLELAPID